MISSWVCKAKCLGTCEHSSLAVAIKITSVQCDTKTWCVHMVALPLHPLLLKQ